MRIKGFWRSALSDWPAKIISVAAALLLFFFYRLNRLEDRYLSTPLSVSMNDEYVPANQYPRSVRMTLRGESNALFKIQEDDIRANLDLSGFRSEGVFRVPVQIEKRGSAIGVDPLEIQADPADVAVSIERRVSRYVSVTPSFRGFLEPGYELVSFDFTPPEIAVYGPASAVNRLSDMTTDFIELAGRSSDFTVKARLVKKDSLVYLSGADTVEFHAIVQKSLAIKTFDTVKIEAEGLSEEFELAKPLPFGKVRIRSSKYDIGGYQPGPGLLTVDLSALIAPGDHEVALRALAPDGYTVESFEPRKIQVSVRAANRDGNRSSRQGGVP